MIRITNLVKNYQYITIFRHTSADADALGSQFGLKLFLQDCYPQKKVYALGSDVGTCAKDFPVIDTVSDEIIKDSIAIVLDCANRERIDDQRYKDADFIIKIDHHPDTDHYEVLQLVDTNSAATCEILCDLFKDERQHISKECAEYLYMGLVSDTLNFTTTNTTSASLKAGAFLIDLGVKPNEIREKSRGFTFNEFKLMNYIRNNVKLVGNVAYSVISKQVYESMGFNYNQTKEKVFVLSDVNEFKVWAIFTEFENGLYNGSLRSKKVCINKVAQNYAGGGHPNASGVKNLTIEDIDKVVSDLNDLFK